MTIMKTFAYMSCTADRTTVRIINAETREIADSIAENDDTDGNVDVEQLDLSKKGIIYFAQIIDW